MFEPAKINLVEIMAHVLYIFELIYVTVKSALVVDRVRWVNRHDVLLL